eukprot:4071677-Prymnesium_polylepis.1
MGSHREGRSAGHCLTEHAEAHPRLTWGKFARPAAHVHVPVSPICRTPEVRPWVRHAGHGGVCAGRVRPLALVGWERRPDAEREDESASARVWDRSLFGGRDDVLGSIGCLQRRRHAAAAVLPSASSHPPRTTTSCAPADDNAGAASAIGLELHGWK